MERDEKSLGRRFVGDVRDANKSGSFKGFTEKQLLLMLGMFLGIFILGVFLYWIISPLFSNFSKDLSFFGALGEMFRKHLPGTMIFMACDALISYLVMYLAACKTGSTDGQKGEGSRVVKIDPSNTGGTTRPQDDDTLRESYDLIPLTEYKKGQIPQGTIIGVTKDSNLVISAPWSSDFVKSLLNQNIWIVGMSGSGKTKYFLIMLGFQDAYLGINEIRTDPKGELFSENVPYCMYKGEEIYVFNTDPEGLRHSDAIDILKLIKASDMPHIMADTLVETLLQASREKKGVGFFEDTNANLLYLACLYVAKAKTFTPFEITNAPTETMPAGYNPDDMGTGLQYYKHRTFDEVCRLITSVKGTDIRSMEERIQKSIMEDPDDAELLRDAFNIWVGHGKVKDDTQSSVAVALKNIVQNPDLRRILSEDEIDVKTLLNTHSSLFLVMPIGENPYANVVSLISSFIMMAVDSESKKGGGSLKIPLRLVFEELGSVTKLSILDKFVSTCRSRNAGICLCTQSLSQGTSLYPDGEFGDIINNCGIQICRVVQSQGEKNETAEYFSARSGEYGAVERMKSYEKGLFWSKCTGESETVKTTRLITTDDIYDLKKSECVLVTASHKGAAIIDNIFFKDHPAYRVKLKNKETGIYEKPNAFHHIPKWRGGKSVNEELLEKYDLVILSKEDMEDLKKKEYDEYLRRDGESQRLVTMIDEIL